MNNKTKAYLIPSYRLQLVRDGYIKAHSITNYKNLLRSIESFVSSDREIFLGLYMNARNQVIAHQVISMGTINANLVHPREVFKTAIIKNACSVIVAHNHPSGGTEPSEADLDITKRLIDAGRLLGIHLLDHIIVTPNGEAVSII